MNSGKSQLLSLKSWVLSFPTVPSALWTSLLPVSSLTLYLSNLVCPSDQFSCPFRSALAAGDACLPSLWTHPSCGAWPCLYWLACLFVVGCSGHVVECPWQTHMACMNEIEQSFSCRWDRGGHFHGQLVTEGHDGFGQGCGHALRIFLLILLPVPRSA